MFRPESATDEDRAHREGLKLHLRIFTIGPTTYRIITLRSATGARRIGTSVTRVPWRASTKPGSLHLLEWQLYVATAVSVSASRVSREQ